MSSRSGILAAEVILIIKRRDNEVLGSGHEAVRVGCDICISPDYRGSNFGNYFLRRNDAGN